MTAIQTRAGAFANWKIARHVIQQAAKKGITRDDWRHVLEGGKVIIQPKHNDRCRECGDHKSFYYAEAAPDSGNDVKIIGCGTCQEFITIYLHERTHRNTPIHEYQIRQGMTSYRLPPCSKCGYRGLVTLEHKTQEQVDAQAVHECRGRR